MTAGGIERGVPEPPPAPGTQAATSLRPTQTPFRPTGAIDPGELTRQEQERRRELSRLRGFNLGAALFGWLVVIGIAALLTAGLAATGAAIALTGDQVTKDVAALSVTGAVLLLIVLFIAYYAGGYVAGRMSRFSGATQGFGVWLIGLLVTVALAIVGALAGSQYNLLSQLRLPSVPVNGQSFAAGAAIAVVAIAVVTLAAAMLGGTMGLRYHHRVDRALATGA